LSSIELFVRNKRHIIIINNNLSSQDEVMTDGYLSYTSSVSLGSFYIQLFEVGEGKSKKEGRVLLGLLFVSLFKDILTSTFQVQLEADSVVFLYS
jgi:hypothetical protein